VPNLRTPLAPRPTSFTESAAAYGLALLATVAAVTVTRFTWPLFSGTPFIPLFTAIVVATNWGSGSAGLIAIVLAAIGTTLAFPAGGPSVSDPRTLPVFIVAGLAANRILIGRNRAAAALRASEAELRATVAAQRKAELDLGASERKLRQAQKLEAIGQLVEGVAHNFNDLLTVTMGYTDGLLDRHPAGDPDHEDLKEIRKATDRGASLTRQLLAFGRKEDAVVGRVDLNELVSGLALMLTRVIPEDIRLTIAAAPAPIIVSVDRSDLEQVILNLVINARDAQPSGGTIHIDVALQHVDALNGPPGAVAPGEYGRLRVRDTGTGMTPEVQSHVFEPFFTTKEVGEGTGLGLAFVHGIARNAGGFVAIDSAPGHGTTVSVYLPPAPHEDEDRNGDTHSFRQLEKF
jgi:signal transduction histidine kinase